MVAERTKEILEASVREFIETGEPITSEGLYKNYDFGIKPAMIRWELRNLAESGYFHQNHPSGGRIPSDRAYQFFIRCLLEKERRKEVTKSRKENKLTAEFEATERQFVQELAHTLETLGMCYEIEGDMLYGSGIEDLLDHVGQRAHEEIVQIAGDLDRIPERIEEHRTWWESEEEWPQVFIGRSPLTTSRHLSVVVGKIQKPNQNYLVIAVGPKRMNYEKSIDVFNYLMQYS
jgi:transcriptional regulator of heat shock response